MDYVLVHGGWHGGWAWRRVADRLLSQGHRVFAPTLTGLADRSHLASPQVDLSTHIDDVLGIFRWERLRDVVLCGHSYGGMVISGVAHRIPEKIRSVVYADALVPRDGESLLDSFEEERRAALSERLKRSDNPHLIPPPSAQSWGLEDPDDIALVDSLTTPHPLRCFEEGVALGGDTHPVSRKVFVLAETYAQPTLRNTMARLDPSDWEMHRFPCSHELMLEMPEQLAQLLAREAHV